MSIIKRYSYWIHSGKYTAIQKFSVLGMGILSFMLLARMVGPKEFGVWGLFMIISSTAEQARIALIKNAFIRFMHQTGPEEQARLQTAALVLSTTISILFAIAFLLLGYRVSIWLKAPLLSGMLAWYSMTILISVFFSHFEMLLNAKMNFRGICWMYCVRQGILAFVILVYFLFRIPLSTFLLSLFYMGSFAMGSVAGYYFVRKDLRWNKSQLRPWLGKLIHYGKYVFGNNVSSMLFRSVDNFGTSYFFGTAVSAYYNSCLRISNLIDMPSQVFADILFPKAAKFNSHDRVEIKKMYEKTVGAILLFSIPALIAVISFPELILHVLAGKRYETAAPILRITAFFGFTLPFLKQFGTIMDATGRPDTNFRVMLLALCINILTNLAGIHLFGVIGAAIGTATTYFITFVITQIILNRKFGIQWQNVFKNCFLLFKELLTHGRSIIRLRTKDIQSTS